MRLCARLVSATLTAIVVLGSAAIGDARIGFDKLQQSYADQIYPTLMQFCIGCHSTQKMKGELDLERFRALADVRRDPTTWQKVAEMLDNIIAAMQIIGKLRPKINVLAVIAATENMPGASAQRPGDVVRAMNGKTIEVINTDAEGRLVLADALCYAREQGITRLVDVATLTGAMVTTLGKACTGVMGNDSKLVQQTIDAGKKTGEKFWELPLFDEYKDLIKSDVADMKNSGGRQAGSISAALLLAEFVAPYGHARRSRAAGCDDRALRTAPGRRAMGAPGPHRRRFRRGQLADVRRGQDT